MASDTTESLLGASKYLIEIFIRNWHIACIASVVIYISYNLFLSPLRNIPGPFVAKISRLWLAYHGYKGDFHQVLQSLHYRYGDIVRVGPNELSIVDTEAVRKIYGINSKFTKSDWYSVSHGTRKFDLFAEASESVHRVQRRIVNHIYSTASLKQLEPYVDSTISHFLQIMSQQIGQPLDFGLWLQLLAFDIIGEITFSRRFGLMDIGKETNVLRDIKRSQHSTSWVSQIPSVFKIHEFLKPVLGNYLAATARNGSVREFTLKLVLERQARGSDHSDMMAKLEEIHKNKPEEFEANDVVSMVTTNVFAGSDTTAVSLRAVIYYLLKNPECKKKVVEEIDEFSRQLDRFCQIFPYELTLRMPYFQAVMYEAMRLHPVVGQTLPRVVPKEGFACGPYWIPAGIVVGTSPFVLGRSQKIFGEDAGTFRPERWLELNKEELRRFWFPFGAGSRVCIGKNLSWIEMSKILTALFRTFDLQLADPTAEWDLKC